MMWSSIKSLTVAVLAASLVASHAIVAAPNQINGLARGDVTRGSTTSCRGTAPGTAAIAADGSVQLTGKNFNGGRDGGLQFTAGLSTTGPNGKFSNVQVTKNGDAAPSGTGTAAITVQLPAGTNCSGGACVLALQSNGGFGNCVALAGTGAAGGAAGGAAATTSAAGTAATTGTGRGGRGRNRGGRNRNGANGGAAAAGAAAAAGRNGRNRNAAANARFARPHARAWFFEETN